MVVLVIVRNEYSVLGKSTRNRVVRMPWVKAAC